MAGFRDFIRGASRVLPEVPKPTRKPSLKERFVWTGIALAIYMVMAQVPLYGIQQSIQDRFAFARIIFASNRGTLMELGIGPIVTAGLVLQVLKGADIIKLDFSKPEDRAIFTSGMKLFTVVVAIVQIISYALFGAFGSVGYEVLLIIAGELIAANFVVMLLDEMIQKGWGIGSGVSLFILAGVAQKILWDMFSPITVGGDYFGAIPYAVNTSLAGNAWDMVFRDGSYPSIFSLLLTLVVIFSIVYVEGIRVEVPITSARFRGFSAVYPIKLLYVSNIPVILVAALLANLNFFTQLFWVRIGGMAGPYLSWLGTFEGDRLTGGLLYWITSPGTLAMTAQEPLRALTYTAFMVIFSVIFAKIWVEVGGLSPRDVAKSLIDAQVQVPGFRRTSGPLSMMLSKYIRTVTILGGIIIGLLAALSDLLGVFGTGIGILLMIDILIQYYQMLVREHVEETMPRLGALFGRG